jgi:hypothetical protein
MPKEEEDAFSMLMERDAKARKEGRDEAARRLRAADEYESIKLYGPTSE